MDLQSFPRAAGWWLRRTCLLLQDRQQLLRWIAGWPGRMLACLLILGILGGAIIFSRLGDAALRNDEAIYARVSDHMHQSGDWWYSYLGKWPYFVKPPLYFWLTNLTYDRFVNDGWRYRFWSALFGLGCVLLTGVLGGRLWGPVVGLLAGGLLLLNGDFVFNHGMREGCMDAGITFCTLVCLLAYWAALSSKRPLAWWLVIGLLAGCASMLKTLTGLPLLGLLGLHYLFLDRREAAGGKIRRLLLAGLVSVAIAVPWIVAQWYRYQDLFVENMFWENVVQRGRGGVDASHIHDSLFYLREIMNSSKPFLLFLPAMLFCLAGSRFGSRQQACSLVGLFTAGWVVFFSLGKSKLSWYVYPVFPLIAVAVAAMLVTALRLLIARLSPGVWGGRIVRFACLLLAVLVLGKASEHIQRIRTLTPEHYAPWQVYSQYRSAIEKRDVLLVLYRLPAIQDENYHWFYAGKMKGVLRTWRAERLQQILNAGRPTILVLRRNDLGDLKRDGDMIECDNPKCFVPTRNNYELVAVRAPGLLTKCFQDVRSLCPIEHFAGRQPLASLSE
jgi:4-amino-4-deoxy-L-arabinose transferase-like glycosyltransferase